MLPMDLITVYADIRRRKGDFNGTVFKQYRYNNNLGCFDYDCGMYNRAFEKRKSGGEIILRM